MRVADVVMDFLAKQGVEHVFTVCGGGSIFLCDALARAPGLKYIACHHEQAAAMAAEGYARARTGLGACLVTSGPGGTNAVTGCAGAWADRVPVIFVSGQVFSTQTAAGRPGLRTVGVQEINIVDIVRPITKYAVMVDDPRHILYHLERAAHTARSGSPGPVWVDIPANAQNAVINPDDLAPAPFVPEQTMKADLAGLMAELPPLLANSRRPLIHVGQGVRLAGAVKAFLELVQDFGIPVLTARNANDIIPSDHPLYIGRPGTFAQRGANFAVQSCDLYIAIGTRLCLAQTGYNAKDYARRAKIVMVDIDPAELEKDTVPLHLKICADAGDFILALDEIYPTGMRWLWRDWIARCKAWQERYPVVLPEYVAQRDFVNSYYFVDRLCEQLVSEDVVVTDMGYSFQCTHQAFRVKAGQRLFTNGGLAAMGWGLPAAIGAAAGTGRRTICIAGDGGLMMNIQELATLVHQQLPVKIFLLNNGGYLTMRQSQELAFDRYMGSDEASGISFPNFRALAGAHGIVYHCIQSHADLDEGIRDTLESCGPALCEIFMDPKQEQAPKSVNRRLPDGTIKQTAIEDAYPYLSREEIEENLRVD